MKIFLNIFLTLSARCHPLITKKKIMIKPAHLINLRMTIKSLERQAKKCENEAAAARNKLKKAYIANNLDAARVYAETSIRHRNQSRYYQMLSARLAPMVDQLKNELSGGVTAFNLNEMQEIVQNINAMEQQSKDNANKLLTTQIELSPNDIDSLMQQLNDEIALEVAHRMPTSIDVSSGNAQPVPLSSPPPPPPPPTTNERQSELEQRLANLRRRL